MTSRIEYVSGAWRVCVRVGGRYLPTPTRYRTRARAREGRRLGQQLARMLGLLQATPTLRAADKRER